MEHYCAYLRKSRVDLEQERHSSGSTLDRHRELLTALSLQLQKPIERFYEEVVSGESISGRPMVQQLLSDIEDGTWSGVFCMDVERLARGDTIDQGIIARTFSITGTKIITPNKTYDPDNEFDEEYFEYGLFTARREYKMINRRIQRGRILSVKQGKYISPIPPYGYERYRLEQERGYSLRPHPEQAEVVRLIFTLYTKGLENENGILERLGTDSIASYLDTIGIKPAKKSVWSRASIRDILKNPTYIGKICWGRRKEEKTLKNGQIIKTRPNTEDFILVDGLHEALIDEETFSLAQKLLKKHAIAPVRNGKILQNPLAGLVYCQKCGQLMTRLGSNSHTKYPTLKCPNRYCDTVAAPIALVEQHMLSLLADWGNQYLFETRELPDNIKSDLSLFQNGLKEIEDELSTLQNQTDRTYTLLEQGVYTSEEFQKRRQLLSEKTDALTKRQEFLQRKIRKLEAAQNTRNRFFPRIHHLLDVYNSLSSAAERNQLLKEVIERIDYSKIEKNRRGSRNNINFTLSLSPRLPS
ncbi:MAG: recombinase family protein [Lachnospiraceae bacterium]|jgi:site-specific DNA recombinase|nr:recombinase family protein [Lachnospiraceae bacterium]